MKSESSRSAKPPSEKRTSSSKTSKTDWARVQSKKEEDIVLTEEHPELDLQQVVRVIRRQGLKPAPPKASVSLRERRHAEIAAFAAEHAGTDFDLDRDLEVAGSEAIEAES